MGNSFLYSKDSQIQSRFRNPFGCSWTRIQSNLLLPAFSSISVRRKKGSFCKYSLLSHTMLNKFAQVNDAVTLHICKGKTTDLGGLCSHTYLLSVHDYIPNQSTTRTCNFLGRTNLMKKLRIYVYIYIYIYTYAHAHTHTYIYTHQGRI